MSKIHRFNKQRSACLPDLYANIFERSKDSEAGLEVSAM